MERELNDLKEQLSLLNQKALTYPTDKAQNVDYYNFLIAGISQISWSKQLFRYNKDLADFYARTFNITFPEYVKKNRALLIGRSIRHFTECTNIHEIKEALNKLFKFIYYVNQETKEVTWADVIDSI